MSVATVVLGHCKFSVATPSNFYSMNKVAHRFFAGFYAMAEPFVKMDTASKNLVVLLTGLMIFGVVAIHVHLNEIVATGTFFGTLLAGSRFLVKPHIQIKKNQDTNGAIG